MRHGAVRDWRFLAKVVFVAILAIGPVLVIVAEILYSSR